MKKFLIAGIILGLFLNSCYKKPESQHFPNQPPETYISNIMIARDTVIAGDTIAIADTSDLPYVSVYVYGYDADGNIIAFQWAIDDTMRDTTIQWTINDTLIDTTICINAWRNDSIGEADGEKMVITFPATELDTFYQHILYVRAMDNNFLVDPTPAVLKIFGKNNYLPHPSLIPWIYEGGYLWAEASNDTQDLYILYDTDADTGLDTTSYWKGISFTWTAIDSDAVSPIMYSYRWDNEPFSSWTYDTTKMFITARTDTILKYEGLHRFQLIARDDAFAISKDTAEVYIRTYRKTFNHKVLLVDATPDLGSFIVDVEMDSFYNVLMDTVAYDVWDNSNGGNRLTMEALAPYSTIVFYMDFPISALDRFNKASEPIIKFLGSGGNLVVMGSQVYAKGIAVSSEKDTIYKKYYFGVRSYEANPDTDFINALSIYDSTMYPEVEYDTMKLNNPSRAFLPGMKNVGIFEKLTAHSIGIYGFDSYTEDPIFQGKPCAVQNESPDGGFKTVFFDFPFYFMKTDSSGEPLKTVIQNAIKFVRER